MNLLKIFYCCYIFVEYQCQPVYIIDESIYFYNANFGLVGDCTQSISTWRSSYAINSFNVFLKLFFVNFVMRVKLKIEYFG